MIFLPKRISYLPPEPAFQSLKYSFCSLGAAVEIKNIFSKLRVEEYKTIIN